MKFGSQIWDVDGLSSNLILLGKIKRMKKEWIDAEKDLKKVWLYPKQNHLKKQELQAYKEIITLKKFRKWPEDNLYYSNQYVAFKDTLSNTGKSKPIAYLEFEQRLAQKEKELSVLKVNKITDALIKAALTSCIFLVSILVFILYEVFKKNKKLLETKNLVAQQTLENLNLKEQELLLEINFKNKELASYALSFVQKNEILKEVQKKLQYLKEKSLNKEAPIFKELNNIIQQHLTADKDWDDFKMLFEQVHTDFYTKLIVLHPDLKTNDLKICSLTRLNLNIKETASILGISAASVKTARYRLRKKLQLEPNQEIVSYLINLENN